MSLTLLAPLVILGTALFAWFYHREISSKRATLEFLTKAEVGSPKWVEAKQAFGNLIYDWLRPLDRERASGKNPMLVLYLNHCELVAVAIHKKALHAERYKLCHGATYVQTWKLAEAYIRRRREIRMRDTLYENFQKLALQWSEKLN